MCQRSCHIEIFDTGSNLIGSAGSGDGCFIKEHGQFVSLQIEVIPSLDPPGENPICDNQEVNLERAARKTVSWKIRKSMSESGWPQPKHGDPKAGVLSATSAFPLLPRPGLLILCKWVHFRS